ncbi:MAG: type II toxin-antitoxin system VapC family toxin [Acidobacteria bacterium]|nr:type II toxin-antitoxin system VapC family toxin [Acidobacteriota bacterium]
MTFAYFDTSIVVKRYVSEPDSQQVRALLRRHDFLSSAITPLEALSALSRRQQQGDLSEKDFTAALRRMDNDRKRWELVEIGATVLDRAEEIVQRGTPLRSLDAIHVASWITFQATSGIRIPFVTADSGQRDAVRQMGLDAVWVG